MREIRLEFPLSVSEPCHQAPVLEGGIDDNVEKGEAGSGKLWVVYTLFCEVETSAFREGCSSID